MTAAKHVITVDDIDEAKAGFAKWNWGNDGNGAVATLANKICIDAASLVLDYMKEPDYGFHCCGEPIVQTYPIGSDAPILNISLSALFEEWLKKDDLFLIADEEDIIAFAQFLRTYADRFEAAAKLELAKG